MAEDRKPEARMYVAKRSFATYRDGVPQPVRVGDMCYGDHPILKTHAQFFAPVDEMPEMTRQSPGERRFLRLPERKTQAEGIAHPGTPQHATHKEPKEVNGAPSIST